MPRKASLKTLRKKAWSALSLYLRNKYSDAKGYCTCYTCNVSKPWKEMQAGHAIGGRNNAVLFDEEIIRIQCPHCNVFMRGQYTIFTLKLIKENGLEWFERKLDDSRQIVKLYRTDYEELIEKYKTMFEVERRSRKWVK